MSQSTGLGAFHCCFLQGISCQPASLGGGSRVPGCPRGLLWSCSPWGHVGQAPCCLVVPTWSCPHHHPHAHRVPSSGGTAYPCSDPLPIPPGSEQDSGWQGLAPFPRSMPRPGEYPGCLRHLCRHELTPALRGTCAGYASPTKGQAEWPRRGQPCHSQTWPRASTWDMSKGTS